MRSWRNNNNKKATIAKTAILAVQMGSEVNELFFFEKKGARDGEER